MTEKTHKPILEDRAGNVLVWRNLATGRHPDYRAFFKVGGKWRFIAHMPPTASEDGANAFLATVMLGSAMLTSQGSSMPTGLSDLSPLMEKAEKMGAEKFLGYRIGLDTLRIRAGEVFNHGVHIKQRVRFQAPKPEGSFNYQVLSPVGALIARMADGAMHRVAMRSRFADHDSTKFGFHITELMCEDKDDALMLAFVMEAHGIDFELY